jgi:hypothetical protein
MSAFKYFQRLFFNDCLNRANLNACSALNARFADCYLHFAFFDCQNRTIFYANTAIYAFISNDIRQIYTSIISFSFETEASEIFSIHLSVRS